MIDNFAFALGKLPKQTDARTLQLSRYLASTVAAPPDQIDWGQKVNGWGMLGNDTVGDCVWAAQGHADMLWSTNAQGAPVPITTAECLAAYEKVTGYNPQAGPSGNNPTDRGTSLLAGLKYWRHTGLDKQTIDAFVEIEASDIDNVKLGIDLFGCVYVGVQLPDSVLPTPSQVPSWTVTPDGTPANRVNPDNGHCIIYSAYDASGPTVVTWGQTVTASWAFHTAYCDEIYAMVAPGWLNSSGVDPGGLDLAALESDLQALKETKA
jgi:hypothetical protein